MSTLVAQTISNGTVSTSSANVIQGSAKAWVNINGPTGAIRASYNVTSVTVNGAGDYTINFTNAFADANYAVAGSIGVGTTSNQAILTIPYNASPTTTALRIGTGNTSATMGSGYTFISVAVFR